MMDKFSVDMLRLVSFNSRGLNSDKKSYLCHLLSECDVLFLQEHWQSDKQLHDLNVLSHEHNATGVCGFSNDDVLAGRPYGGCAIFWRNTLSLSVRLITTNSRRISALLLTSNAGLKLLCLSVYMPYEHDLASFDDFQFELSVIDSLISQYADCHVIIGGDFNVDFDRNRLHTTVLDNFCVNSSLFPVYRHRNSCVDYTYHFNMQSFSVIDHFLVSEQLFQHCVLKQYVSHDVDNMSDHDALCLRLQLDISCFRLSDRVFYSRPSWTKATDAHINSYQNALRSGLDSIAIPHSALVCQDPFCCDAAHIADLNTFVREITAACLQAADCSLPTVRLHGSRGSIPGWSEFVEPLRKNSLFWHKVWIECGRPHDGTVASIMRKTRAKYHHAIREVRRKETDIVNLRFASALTENRSRDFWHEVKHIRNSKNKVSSVVDDCCNADDVANLFSTKYQDLYTSVSYDDSEMMAIRDDINNSLSLDGSYDKFSVNVDDVCSAIFGLKRGKSDANGRLSSDHFIFACKELAVYLSFLFSALLVHGHVPSDILASRLIPIPKGKNTNITNSANYRAIALSSVFVKVFDVIFLHKFNGKLCTSEMQFGFKRNHSTTMCSMVLKETLAYYTTDGGVAFCTLLDATKAFDRVNYCKLFRELLKRDLPAGFLRLLLNMYTNNVAHVFWNGFSSRPFCVMNGVRQGGIISPILFCVYLDGLLLELRNSNVGCYIGNFFVGALAYADDLALLAPSASAMRLLLKICDDYSKKFSIVFNASKSACLMVTRYKLLQRCIKKPEFYIDGKFIDFVNEYAHLGHIISDSMDDKHDILHRRNMLCGKINNVLCFFCQQNPVVKLQLMCRYCSDHYGSVLWDLNNPLVEDFCIVWRKGLRRSFDLPRCTHSLFVPVICGLLPLKYELSFRQAVFIDKCLNSVNSSVKFVLRNGLYFSRMHSPIGRSAQFCSTFFEVPLQAIGCVKRSRAWQLLYDRSMYEHCDRINVIRELLAVKHGYLELHLFSSLILNAFIEF